MGVDSAMATLKVVTDQRERIYSAQSQFTLFGQHEPRFHITFFPDEKLLRWEIRSHTGERHRLPLPDLNHYYRYSNHQLSTENTPYYTEPKTSTESNSDETMRALDPTRLPADWLGFHSAFLANRLADRHQTHTMVHA